MQTVPTIARHLITLRLTHLLTKRSDNLNVHSICNVSHVSLLHSQVPSVLKSAALLLFLLATRLSDIA